MPQRDRKAEVEGTLIHRAYGLDGVSFRDTADGEPFGFQGHAAVFDRKTWIGPKRWGFWESVSPGAFKRSIGEHDIRFLYNHDPAAVMARNTAGDLRLSEDKVGLKVDADLPADDLDVQRLVPKLRNKHVTQMSFGFEVLADTWEEDEDTGEQTRTITEVKLWEVSPVPFPAYEDTDAGLRGVAFDVLATRLGLSTNKRSRLIAALADDNLTDEAVAILRSASHNLAVLLDGRGPAPATCGPDENPPGPPDGTRESEQQDPPVDPRDIVTRFAALQQKADAAA